MKMNHPEHFLDHDSYGLPPIPDKSIVTQIRALKAAGFVVGPRDPNMNRAFEGKYMVAEPYEAGTIQDDAQGGDGVWCLVGDDITVLLREAISYFPNVLDDGTR